MGIVSPVRSPTRAAGQKPGRVVSKLPAGARVVVIGDSIIEYNSRITGTNDVSGWAQSAGEIVWAKALFPAFRFEWIKDTGDALGRKFTGMNHGDAGDTANGMAGARMTAALAMLPDVLIIAAGTNDITGGATAQQTIDRLIVLYEAALAEGVAVVLCTIRPRSDWATPDAATDPRYAIRDTVNSWIRGLNVDGVTVWDPNPDIEDPASRSGSGGHPKTGYMDSGGVHPGTLGGYYGALSLVTVLRRLIKNGNIYADFAEDNLLPNWQLTGTDGARTPTTAGLITGPAGGALEIASGWRVARQGGNNATAVETAKETLGGEDVQALTFKPGGSSDYESWEFQVFTAANRDFARPAEISDGDWVQATVQINPSSFDQWRGYQLSLTGRTGSGGTVVFASEDLTFMDRTNQKFPENTELGWLQLATPPFLVNSDMTYFTWLLRPFIDMQAAASNGVLRIRRPSLKVVPAPSTHWS